MTTSRTLVGIGLYTIPEASRLLKIPAINISRWLKGYSFQHDGAVHEMPPLWHSQIENNNEQLVLGFRDLIELRFVQAFVEAGLSLITIRHCLRYAQQCLLEERPFSSRGFLTDGRTIFLESAQRSGDPRLLDLRKGQYVLRRVIERSFKDLDIDDNAVKRWRPFRGKKTIVIDPERAFGQPVAAKSGVPTVTLFQALTAEDSIKEVSRLYEVQPSVVQDAAAYERTLLAA